MNTQPTSTSALSSRSFLTYLIGSTVSLHGLWIYRVALGWFAWEITGSEFWVGLVAFTQFAPAVVFGPIFGVLADRFDRRKASIVINALGTINMLLLGLLAWLGYVDIYVLAAQSLVQGALDGAHTPVRMTLVPSLVPKEQLQSAIASASISFNLSRFIGPAIAGTIIATQGVAVAFAVNGISYIAYIVALSLVELRPSITRSKAPGDVTTEMLDGIRYIVQHRTIRGLLLIVAVASVFGRGALEMMPAFADAIFQRGPSGLAILTAALGAGAIASGLILSRNTLWLDSRVIKISVVTAGLFIVVLGATESFWLAVPVVVSLGVILSLCGVGSQILIQTLVDDDVRGRVSSFWGMIAFGGTALGSLVVGSASAAFGLQTTVMVSGGLCCIVALMAPVRHEPASSLP
ncbi:MAG: MFS transporter [Gammaproteobacteria bacterium]|jgi:MFS family permease|nr:MFS transporter [Gammaproteobacteria bacterium]